MNPVEFIWNENTPYKNRKNKKDIGFIAQDINKIAPFLVSKNYNYERNEYFKMINYDKIVPILVWYVKNLQKQIDELKNK